MLRNSVTLVLLWAYRHTDKVSLTAAAKQAFGTDVYISELSLPMFESTI